MTSNPDVIVVGGGIVGLATARALQRSSSRPSVLVLEKEDTVGSHQTGHNSGVLHSGLYYRPGSHKARLCVEGRRDMLAFCEDNDLPISVTGKLVIATRQSELEPLQTLEERAAANGLKGVARLGPDGIRDIEPHAIGLAALHVPEAGVVDFPAVAAAMAADPTIDVRTSQPVTAIRATETSVEVETPAEVHRAQMLVNCAGLHSDRVAAMAGLAPEVLIVPFRGEYYTMSASSAPLVKALIYPVPDPRFPFLGVHFTRRIDGAVEVGPNAVLAFGREHYRQSAPNWADTKETITYPGMRRLVFQYWRTGMSEMVRSRLRSLYARSARRLIPDVTAADLLPGGSGVRAQAVTRDGKLLDDFAFMEGPRSLHVLNAPSPAATASLAIGKTIAERALASLARDG